MIAGERRARWVEASRHAEGWWLDWQRTYWESLRTVDHVGIQAHRAMYAEYRRQILAAFWQHVAPLRPGDLVPHRVAELLAEEWDESTRAPR